MNEPTRVYQLIERRVGPAIESGANEQDIEVARDAENLLEILGASVWGNSRDIEGQYLESASWPRKLTKLIKRLILRGVKRSGNEKPKKVGKLFPL